MDAKAMISTIRLVDLRRVAAFKTGRIKTIIN